jgi:hypothetical protein
MTDAVHAAGLTLQLGKPGLVAGTTTTYTIGTAFTYAIRGKAYSKGTATNAATPTTDGNTGAAFVALTVGKGSVFVFGVNAAGTVSAYQGSVEDLTAAADGANASFERAPQLPAIPGTVCPFGYLVVKVGDSGTTWTFGSSNMSGVSNVSYAFQDIVALPDRPQVS